MSISLGTAFELTDADFSVAWRLLSAFRADLQRVGHQDNAYLHAKMATLIIDRAATLALRDGELPAEVKSPIAEVREDIKHRRREITRTMHRDPSVDFDFSVTLFPIQNRMLGMVYSEQDSWIEALFAKEGVCHAPWWNNTDRPDDVSQDVWSDRERIWKDIFARDLAGRPSHCGLTFEMTPYLSHLKIDDVVSAQESFDGRLTRMARECLTHNAIRQADATEMSQVISCLGKVDDYLRTDPGQQSLEVYKGECAKMMKKSLERDDFLGS